MQRVGQVRRECAHTRRSKRLRRLDLRKASGFPANPAPTVHPAQAGRLSLPACAGCLFRWGVLRKGRAFPQVRRQSRSTWPTTRSVMWTSLPADRGPNQFTIPQRMRGTLDRLCLRGWRGFTGAGRASHPRGAPPGCLRPRGLPNPGAGAWWDQDSPSSRAGSAPSEFP